MNKDDLFQKAAQRAEDLARKLRSPEVQDVLKTTQAQAEEAAGYVGDFLKTSGQKLKAAADTAAQAIRDDIDRRPG